MSRWKQAALGGTALVALGVGFTGGWEGKRNVAYLDIVGVPTVCYGETRGIRLGMRFTDAQCDAMLVEGLGDFAAGIEACVPALADPKRVSDKTYVAHLSLSYNIGIRAYCRSTAARLMNAGRERWADACHAIRKFNMAGGRVIRGLDRRRAAEEKLCLEGL